MIPKETLEALKDYLNREHPAQRDSIVTVGDYVVRSDFKPYYLNASPVRR